MQSTLLTCNDRLLWDTWTSSCYFPALTVADEIGLFAFLEQTPATLEETASKLALGLRGAEALLGLMVSIGFLTQRNAAFYLTDTARTFLLPDSRYYWGGILHLMKNLPVSHETVMNAIKNDASTFYSKNDIWETHEIDSEQAKKFAQHMHSQTIAPATAAAQSAEFAGRTRLLDIGGGIGTFCLPLADKYPQMKFTILELSVVCKIANEFIITQGLNKQIDTVAMDFFKDPWPRDYDGIIFSNIFHDWGKEKCEFFVRQSFDALEPGGKIFIHEILLNDGKDMPRVATAYSLILILMTQGKQYSAPELFQMLSTAGFTDLKVINTYGYYSMVVGSKPK